MPEHMNEEATGKTDRWSKFLMSKWGVAAICGACVALFVAGMWLTVRLSTTTDLSGISSNEIGDTAGAVNCLFSAFALVGVIYAIFMQRHELMLQREELKQTHQELAAQKAEFEKQNATMRRQQFETKFYQMLSLLQNAVEQMSYNAANRILDTDTIYIEPREFHGREVFQIFYYQFVLCRNELNTIFSRQKDFINQEYKQKLEDLEHIRLNHIDIEMLAKIEIWYSIVFFGLNFDGKVALQRMLNRKYDNKLTSLIIDYIKLKPAKDIDTNKRWKLLQNMPRRSKLIEAIEEIYEWRNNQNNPHFKAKYPEISVGYRSAFETFYGGFHQTMGLYFRHLYQLIRMVDSDESLTDQEKYDYVRIVRSQMSNYEQIVFLLNSLTSMGHNWEINPDSREKGHPNLITTYQLAKNIPSDILAGIRLRDFYPNLKLEFLEN